MADIAASVEAHAEAILKASGSSLRHYTIPMNRAAILGAVMNCYEEAYRAGAALALESLRTLENKKENTNGE